MDKNESKKIVYKYFKFNKNVISIFNSQIDEFYNLKEKFVLKKSIYKQTEDVYLDENTLIHGTRILPEQIELIKNNDLIAPEFLGIINKNKKKPFVVEFWRVNEKISLKDFIDKYCGVTIDVKGNNGNIINRIITPIKKIDDEIINLKNYRDYIIYQNQEQRFLPNKYSNNSTMAFIIRINSDNENLLTNDIFSTDFDKNILKKIVPKWFYNKYMKNRNFDNYETGRERAILYGVPSNLIEGILVNRIIENNSDDLKKIKDAFPNCYICNLDGKVIK